ncbi:MAG: BspA family leucine-rich repeat surface protein [Patescibacteria group bacterium]
MKLLSRQVLCMMGFFMLWGTFASAAPIEPGAFSTTWSTGSDTFITITLGDCDDGEDVYWEEVGNEANNGTDTCQVGLTTITFPYAGEYRVDFKGNWTSVNFGGQANRNKFRTVEQWGNSVWTALEYSFSYVYDLTFNATDVPDLSNVTSLAGMFEAAENFNSPLNTWDVSNVTDMQSMFDSAIAFNQPLNNWDVSAVTTMRRMFRDALNFNQSLSNWDVSNVTDMDSMFSGGNYGINAFNQPLNDWDVSSVQYMSDMFASTAFNQPLDDWDISVTNSLYGMFYNSSFDQTLGNWDIRNITNFAYIFDLSNISTLNYSDTLERWAALPTLQNNMNLYGVGQSSSRTPYCDTVQAARDILVTTYNWIINDGGSTPCFTISYTAGLNATLIGQGTQTVIDGEDSTEVEVVPDAGFRFVKWSDESTQNPRTDTNLEANLTVSAIIEADPSGGGSSATRVGDRPKSYFYSPSSTSTPLTVTKESFIQSVRNLIDYLTKNEADLANLTPEESVKIIVGLREILRYLLTLLPGV